MAKIPLRVYNREIETMIDRNLLDEAVAHCRHILKTFPKHLETYRLLGKAYLEYKRYPDAADIFSRVLLSVPSDFVSNVGMSIIRDEENKLDDAIWHMERAFETQPSNAAIQSELQRLYARRDGVAPPRIRMTRGALAHMYVQGELYPQAISEIQAVLKDDPGRNDMQVLLARAYYKSGLKNDAADAASTVLRNNPYSLDANRVLVEILGVDHPESVQAYRQRVIELDPYAAQVTSSVFLSDEVPDNAVTIERLDWNGQPVGMQADWETRQAISLESGPQQEEQPDWLKSSFAETAPSSVQPTAVAPFDAAPPSAKPVEPEEEIPDFLRAAGWGKSTGAFDESQSPFAEAERERASTEPTIERGELPDWVKALAPQQPEETPPEEEQLPDWINQIGTSSLPVPAQESEQPDWMNQPSQPPAQPAEEVPDWLKQLGAEEQPTAPAAAEEPDWLKGFASETDATAPASAEPSGEMDWLAQLSQEPEAKTVETPANEFDFLNKPVEPLETAASENQPAAADDFDFLNPLGSRPESTPTTAPAEEFDFLNEFTEEAEQLTPPAEPSTSPSSEPANLGMSEEEQDDSFAWLEGLAAKQGATEGLLTQPEERQEEEPDWIKQAKATETVEPAMEEPEGPPAEQAPAGLEELGKTEQELDDSFAWLESLAAKQGATEGLLTKPEERREEEPEWVRQAKSLSSQPEETPTAQVPEEEAPVAEAPTEPEAKEPGESEQERDETFAWLESLAAKQGATEGLLTQPEERPQEEPEWIKHVKDLEAQELAATTPAPEQPAAADETAAWLRSLDEEGIASIPQAEERLEEEAAPTEEPSLEAPTAAQPASAMDESAAWLLSLDEELTSATEPSGKDDTAIWLKGLEETRETPREEPEAMQPEELPAWMQNIEEEQAPAAETAAPQASEETAETSEWIGSLEEQPTTQETPKVETGGLPSWLRGLEEEEARESAFASDTDLPSWLRDETGDVIAEPTKIEPTRATDWQPVESKQPEAEPAMPEPVASQPEPEPEPAVSDAPESVAPPPEPEPIDVVSILEEKIVAAELEPESPAPPPAKEPVARKVTGTLTDPVLGQARSELSRNNLFSALDNYGRLIKKGRFLEDVIYDLREASYRYPVDVDIWQSLGDAYMRANRLQDALDAYTKAEELLR